MRLAWVHLLAVWPAAACQSSSSTSACPMCTDASGDATSGGGEGGDVCRNARDGRQPGEPEQDPIRPGDPAGDTPPGDAVSPGDGTGDSEPSAPEDGFVFTLFPAFVISTSSWRDYSFAVEAGARATSVYVGWHELEPNAPVGGSHNYTFNAADCVTTGCLDTTVRSAQEHGLLVDHIAVLPAVPAWVSCADPACPGAGSIRECVPDAASRADLAAFVTAMVERYDGDGIHDMAGLQAGVRHWSIGNELTYPSDAGVPYDCGAAADFLTMWSEFHAAVRAADRDARLVSPRPVMCVIGHLVAGEVCNIPAERKARFEVFFDQVDPTEVDVIGIHPYQRWERLPGWLDALRVFLKTPPRALGDKPIWLVENGDAGVDGVPDEAECITAATDRRQAGQVIKRFVPAVARGVQHASWFGLYWYSTSRDFAACDTPLPDPEATTRHAWENMNLLQYDWTAAEYVRRPGFTTYQLMVEKLTGFTSVTILAENVDGLFAYRFLRDGTPIWVLWAAGHAQDVALNTGGDALLTRPPTVRGGAPRVEVVAAVSGEVTVPLDDIPAFVEPAP